jgi:hypothetical protein
MLTEIMVLPLGTALKAAALREVATKEVARKTAATDV